MNVTETSAEGLKREFKITIPASEVEEQITKRLDELGRMVRIPGFRPGKVPLPLLRKRYGAAVRGEVLESAVQDSSAEAIRERNLRPALPPRYELVSSAEGADLEYTLSLEVLPELPAPDFGALGLERLVAQVPDEDVEKALERLAESQRKSEPVERPAETGDIIVADIVGRTGDEEIPGSRGEGREIELGAEGLLPGFSDQLTGVSAGEQREVKVTFPAEAGPEMDGKEGVFQVSVKEVRRRLPAAIDDTLAEAVGLESLDELRGEIRQRMQRDYDNLARQRLKRALLDKLAERYEFPVPPGMIEIEFNSIWAQYEGERDMRRQIEARAADNREEQAGGPPPGEGPIDAGNIIAPEETALEGASDRAPATAEAEKPAQHETEAASHHAIPHPGSSGEPIDAAAVIAPEETALEGASDTEPAAPADTEPTDTENEEKTREEFRRIAERRVRLGLLLAEVGRNNNIQVSQDELNQALLQEARRHPGYERQVFDYYRKNPDALNNLRVPIFEDKVVDFIFELAKPAERSVTPQALMAADQEAETDEETGPA
ncbi:MAG: trigger factor [Alphaproteobacteria bacterium]